MDALAAIAGSIGGQGGRGVPPSLKPASPAAPPLQTPPSARPLETVDLSGFASTLQTLEGRLDSAKKAAAKGAQETTVARMHGAAQTLKLKKAQVDLEAALRECMKETRLRKKAEDRVKELEAIMKDPSTRNAQGPAGLTLEASQALIEKLHESYRKSKECEARLKEVEKELQQARAVALRDVEAALATPCLEQKVSGLMQELQQSRSLNRALQVEAAVSVRQRKNVDAAVQIDSGAENT